MARRNRNNQLFRVERLAVQHPFGWRVSHQSQIEPIVTELCKLARHRHGLQFHANLWMFGAEGADSFRDGQLVHAVPDTHAQLAPALTADAVGDHRRAIGTRQDFSGFVEEQLTGFGEFDSPLCPLQQARL